VGTAFLQGKRQAKGSGQLTGKSACVLALFFGALILAQLSSAEISSAEISTLPKKTASKAPANGKGNKGKADKGQPATVAVDGAAVYEAPNFDSPVMEYLDQGKTFRVSTKVFPGSGGLGSFYKVRIRDGVYGYITDVDVEISGRKGSDAWKVEGKKGDDFEGGSDTLDSRYFGVSAVSVNYTEVIANQKKSAMTSLFGIRWIGPTGFFGGLPIDFEFVATNRAPQFYQDVASETSGYLMMSHLLMNFPLYAGTRNMLSLGLGPSFRFSMFDVRLSKMTPGIGSVDSQEAAFGAQANLGFLWGLTQRWALRFDGRYNYENEAYAGFSVSILRR
jgi:hypothetical protein